MTRLRSTYSRYAAQKSTDLQALSIPKLYLNSDEVNAADDQQNPAIRPKHNIEICHTAKQTAQRLPTDLQD